MTKRVVLFQDRGTPLLLNHIKYGGDEIIGYVVNGAWYLRITNDELQACDSENVVNRWPKTVLDFIPVPDDMDGDYNEIILWAEGQLP